MMRAAVLFAALTSFPALAQTVCHERGEFVEQLGRQFAETPLAMGLTADGKVLEVLVSNGGSWTIIVTMPTGMTCGVAAGDSWSEMPWREVTAEGTPS